MTAGLIDSSAVSRAACGGPLPRHRGGPLALALLLALSTPWWLASWCSSAQASGVERGGDRIELRRQMLEIQRTWRASAPVEGLKPVQAAPLAGDGGLPVSPPRSDYGPAISPDGADSAIRLDDVERDQLRRQLRQRRLLAPATD